MISGCCHFSLLFICRSLMSVFVICALMLRMSVSSLSVDFFPPGLFKPNSRRARLSIFVLKDRRLAPPERRGMGWNLLSVSVQTVWIKVNIVNGTLMILEFFPWIFPASGVPALTAGLRIVCMFWCANIHTRSPAHSSPSALRSQVNAQASTRFNTL